MVTHRGCQVEIELGQKQRTPTSKLGESKLITNYKWDNLNETWTQINVLNQTYMLPLAKNQVTNIPLKPKYPTTLSDP